MAGVPRDGCLQATHLCFLELQSANARVLLPASVSLLTVKCEAKFTGPRLSALDPLTREVRSLLHWASTASIRVFLV